MKVLVITTRNIPELQNNSKFRIINSDNMSRYCNDSKDMPKDIRRYLESYSPCSESVSNNLKDFANAKGNDCQIPLLKRQVNQDLLIYVTLCLDKEYCGFGDGICHGYLNAVLDDVTSDTNDGQNEFHLLAHCMDIVQPYNWMGLSRPVSKDELKNEGLKKRLSHISIYFHDRYDPYYRNIITKISSPDDELKAILENLEY